LSHIFVEKPSTFSASQTRHKTRFSFRGFFQHPFAPTWDEAERLSRLLKQEKCGTFGSSKKLECLLQPKTSWKNQPFQRHLLGENWQILIIIRKEIIKIVLF